MAKTPEAEIRGEVFCSSYHKLPCCWVSRTGRKKAESRKLKAEIILQTTGREKAESGNRKVEIGKWKAESREQKAESRNGVQGPFVFVFIRVHSWLEGTQRRWQ